MSNFAEELVAIFKMFVLNELLVGMRYANGILVDTVTKMSVLEK